MAAAKRPREEFDDWDDFVRERTRFKANCQQCDRCDTWVKNHEGRVCDRCRLRFCGECLTYDRIFGDIYRLLCDDCLERTLPDTGMTREQLPTSDECDRAAASIFTDIAMTMPDSWPVHRVLDEYMARTAKNTKGLPRDVVEFIENYKTHKNRDKFYYAIGNSIIKNAVEHHKRLWRAPKIGPRGPPMVDEWTHRPTAEQMRGTFEKLTNVRGWRVDCTAYYFQSWGVVTSPEPSEQMMNIARMCLLQSRFR